MHKNNNKQRCTVTSVALPCTSVLRLKVKSCQKNAVVLTEVVEVVVAEILAVEEFGVLKGGVANVDVAVFDKTGKGSFVNLAPVVVRWHWSYGGLCAVSTGWPVAGCSLWLKQFFCLWLLAATVKVA